jgi:hypothetical protein
MDMQYGIAGKILAEKLPGEAIGGPRGVWENRTEINLRQIALAQWLSRVNVVKNIRVIKVASLLTS